MSKRSIKELYAVGWTWEKNFNKMKIADFIYMRPSEKIPIDKTTGKLDKVAYKKKIVSNPPELVEGDDFFYTEEECFKYFDKNFRNPAATPAVYPDRKSKKNRSCRSHVEDIPSPSAPSPIPSAVSILISPKLKRNRPSQNDVEDISPPLALAPAHIPSVVFITPAVNVPVPSSRKNVEIILKTYPSIDGFLRDYGSEDEQIQNFKKSSLNLRALLSVFKKCETQDSFLEELNKTNAPLGMLLGLWDLLHFRAMSIAVVG